MIRHLVLVVVALSGASAGHPCETEIASACPDSPKSEVGTCLKDSQQHEKATTISSACTDFIALNRACSEEIEQLCEEDFFSEDTMPCLTKWRSGDEISEKCTAVMNWALPAEEEEAVVTDELGMSEQDYAEKKEWQAKRKAARGDAIERLKMKEQDSKKEQERRELERFKEEQPEEYAAMLQQQEEEKRQKAEIKRRERMVQAALERKRREEAGEAETEAPKGKKEKKSGSWLPSLSSLVALAILGGIGYVVLMGAGVLGSTKKAGKKKRG